MRAEEYQPARDSKQPRTKAADAAETSREARTNPAYYIEGRRFEPIAVIEDWGLGFHEGNALKYISRAGRKGGPEDAVKDLEKAIWYLERALAKRRLATPAEAESAMRALTDEGGA